MVGTRRTETLKASQRKICAQDPHVGVLRPQGDGLPRVPAQPDSGHQHLHPSVVQISNSSEEQMSWSPEDTPYG